MRCVLITTHICLHLPTLVSLGAQRHHLTSVTPGSVFTCFELLDVNSIVFTSAQGLFQICPFIHLSGTYGRCPCAPLLLWFPWGSSEQGHPHEKWTFVPQALCPKAAKEGGRPSLTHSCSLSPGAGAGLLPQSPSSPSACGPS